MINSLFESFDPQISSIHSNILTILISGVTPIFLTYFYSLASRSQTTLNILFKGMFNELNASNNNNNNKTNILIIICSFLLILSLNLIGLFPYVYTVTSQILFSLNLALPIWVSLILFSVVNNFNHFFSHLVPLSTPIALSQFITIIETVSQLIRPITLSVRLCANMTAGHILIALASSPIIILNLASINLIILLILEIAVAFIQSYVFVILLSIYLSETL